jgi:hypothetical protein
MPAGADLDHEQRARRRRRSLDVITGHSEGSHVYPHLFVRDAGAQILFVWARESTDVRIRLPQADSMTTEYQIDATAESARQLNGRELPVVLLQPGAVRLLAITPWATVARCRRSPP